MTKDSALERALRTLVQVIVGLVLAVWAVPGVPGAVEAYLQANIVTVALAIGVPAALTSFVWNVLRKDVPNV